MISQRNLAGFRSGGCQGGLVNSVIHAQDGIQEEEELLLSDLFISDLKLRFAALVGSFAGVVMKLPVCPLYPLV